MEPSLDDESRSFNSAVGSQLRAEASAQRISVSRLADLMGMHRTTLNRYLEGERDIPVKVIYAAADVLNLSPEIIVERATERMTAQWELAAHSNPTKMQERKAREQGL